MFKAAVCPALHPLNPPNPPQGRPGKPYVQQQPGPQPLQFNKFQRSARPTVFQSLKATVFPPLKLLNPSRSQDRPRPTVFKGVQGCRLPGLNPLKRSKPFAGPRGQALRPAAARATAPSIQQLNSSGWHAQLFFRVFKATVCPPLKLLNPLNPPSRSQDRPRPTVFKGIQGCRLPGLKPLKRSKRFAGLRRQAVRPAAASATTPSIQQIPAVGSPPVFQRLQAYRLPASKLLNPLNPPSRSQDRPRPTVFKGVQGCRLPGLKPLKRSKPFAGPRRQALRPAAARATAP